MSKTFRSPKENLVPKASQTAHIKGTLDVVKVVDKKLEIVGSKVGVVNTVNGEDIAGIHDNCAWLEAPLSLAETLNSHSTITFAAKTEFYDADITDDVTVSKINGQDYSKYVKVDPDMKYNVGGKKTFGTGSSASKITAKSFNGLTLDQLITKKSPQEISGTSTFNAAVTADKISAGVQDAPPTIDGETLSSLISKDIDGGNNDASKKFSTIKINDGASIRIKNKMNTVDLVARTGNIVKKDSPSVQISGGKTFEKQVAFDKIQVENIHTNKGQDGQYTQTYQVEDFVDIKNPQSLSTGKIFEGSVKLGDLTFIGEAASINDVKMSSLQNCWIDTSAGSQNPFNEVTRRVNFEELA